VTLLDTGTSAPLFAHEAGHILSATRCMRQPRSSCCALSSVPGLPLPLLPLRHALLEWYRAAAELSCDRAAALVTRDPVAVCHC